METQWEAPSIGGNGPGMKRVLIVDDDMRSRLLLMAMVEYMGHEAEDARDGFEALAKVRLGFDLVLLDIVMPGIDGFEVVRQLREDPETADLPVLMVTGMDSKEERIRSIRVGANDFISKPVDSTELSVRMSFLLKMKEAQDEIKRTRAELQEMLEKRTSILRKSLEEMANAQRMAHEAQLETIHRLAVAAELKDKDTGAHIKRMSRFSSLVARGLGLPPGEVEMVFRASPMHDVGKLGIPDKNLLKPGRLDEEEWRVMKQHTVIGSRILGGSSSDLLRAGEVIALSHHERWDGSGYPAGLREEEIPLWGRICAVADVFDALTSPRPYKKAFPNEEAYALMQEGRGTHFDPRVLEVFFDRLEEVEEIQARHRDEELLCGLEG
ncbi:MAG: response regulator [Candidatus Tectomicrobia bacterium]|uniref:Response regulator n=1 Tax=Tectimicrobiota bacterium TaxID=2528274 RepID=A0A932I0Q9_UNCTE|nr:response regulator [Candidatus Tectomicrobia bacterium]